VAAACRPRRASWPREPTTVGGGPRTPAERGRRCDAPVQVPTTEKRQRCARPASSTRRRAPRAQHRLAWWGVGCSHTHTRVSAHRMAKLRLARKSVRLPVPFRGCRCENAASNSACARAWRPPSARVCAFAPAPLSRSRLCSPVRSWSFKGGHATVDRGPRFVGGEREKRKEDGEALLQDVLLQPLAPAHIATGARV